MATTEYIQDVQELYVAYFGRPADPDGLDFWTNNLGANANLFPQVVSAFSTSSEYRSTYENMDNRAIVMEVYENLFSRAGDEAGVSFWTNALDTGAITIDDMVMKIIDGAQGSDEDIFNAKVLVAAAFTNRVDTPEEKAAYSGDAANQLAIDYLAAIDDLSSAASSLLPSNIDAVIERMDAAVATTDEAQLVGVAEPMLA
jgi:hypothetical protein